MKGVLSMAQYTDNPLADYYAHEAEEHRRLSRLPKCDICGEPITDENLYEINGELVCEVCLNEHYRRSVSDFI